MLEYLQTVASSLCEACHLENEIAKEFTAPMGSVVVFDKGFNGHEWHNSLTRKGIYWVTRIRGNAKYEVIEDREFVINGNVLSDQVIQYTSMQHRKEKIITD